MFKIFVTSLWFATLILGGTQVDLGYSIYQGVSNSTTGLTTFFGWANALNIFLDLLLMLMNIHLGYVMLLHQLVH
jgi:hypothetical protein